MEDKDTQVKIESKNESLLQKIKKFYSEESQNELIYKSYIEKNKSLGKEVAEGKVRNRELLGQVEGMRVKYEALEVEKGELEEVVGEINGKMGRLKVFSERFRELEGVEDERDT